jgi:peroxiredoxin
VISVGQPAPDITLPNHRGEQVSLSDFRGRKLMLVIYPQDFSPVCSDQLELYQEILPRVEEAGAALVGISVDSSWVHNAFRKKLGVEIPLLSDFHPKGEALRSLGAYLEEWGTANRSLVLIDEQGIVRWVHAEDTPVTIPSPDLLLEALSG